MLETPRLRLVRWAERHRLPFRAMLADPAVMADQGGPLSPRAADAKRLRYAGALTAGIGRWAIEDEEGFCGYVGAMPAPAGHPLGRHHEIGWRLARAVWGRGYATEAAGAALADLFARTVLCEVLAYTAAENNRSRAVMARLALRRDRARDFITAQGWRGLTWVADRP